MINLANVLLPLYELIANMSKQFRLHTTETSLGLPDTLFLQKFHFLKHKSTQVWH